ncbi:GDP-mannose 4,6-dehydratase [Myxococcota bacterium]|nr:GDP-mannose 4,6-dehydratase [Myxococcota bacterium]MBU1410296.1 GDP-mannose 4,6-dehydratase [Myxococcota bacterium]MBU1510896.1 GDP-mannose 4,6-dehydratase [Myxococcota bacterium]
MNFEQPVLLTGVAGFIASRTARFLLDAGVQVIGVDNCNDYYDVRLKRRRLEALIGRPGFTFHELDIENLSALKLVFEIHRPRSVLNLAARAGVGYSLKNPHVYLTTNASGTLNLLEMMRAFDVKKMVLASTSSLYAGLPMPFSESLPVNTPISPYAASKKAAEVMAYSYHFLFGMDISIVRYFTVFGPAGRPDMSIYRFIQWIEHGRKLELTGDGSQSRDFTFVDDIARGSIAALRPVGFEVINLGGGRNPRTMMDVIHHIENSLGKSADIHHLPMPPEDMQATWADIDKAGRLLDWTPEISLEEGLDRTIAWHLENRDFLAGLRM